MGIAFLHAWTLHNSTILYSCVGRMSKATLLSYLTVGLLNAPEDNCLHSIRLLSDITHVTAEMQVCLLHISIQTNAALVSLFLRKPIQVAGELLHYGIEAIGL